MAIGKINCPIFYHVKIKYAFKKQAIRVNCTSLLMIVSHILHEKGMANMG